MMKFRVVRETETPAEIPDFSYKMEPSCGNDSSSSGVISDQSSSNCGIIVHQGRSYEPRSGSSISSYSSSSHPHSTSSTVPAADPANPSPATSVHWGETRVHTYEREDTTDNEEMSISSYPPSVSCDPCLEDIVEIDVDKVIESSSSVSVVSASIESQPTASPMPATPGVETPSAAEPQKPSQNKEKLQYVETNLDATDIKCPACVFDCGPIHPYMKNSILQPHQCIHEDANCPNNNNNNVHHIHGSRQSSSSLSSSESSYAYLPSTFCAHPQLHRHFHPPHYGSQQLDIRACVHPGIPVSASADALSSFVNGRCPASKQCSRPKSLSSTGSIAENNSPFACISHNLLVHIFSNLTAPDLARTARVCKRWYRAAWTPSLWASVSMNVPTSAPFDADKALRTVTKILSYSTYPLCKIIQRIVIHGSSSLTDRGVNTLAKRCPELRSVDIRGCAQVTNLAIFELVSRCLNLEVLNVSGCEQISCISLTPEASRQTPHPTGNRVFLRYLDLSSCPRVDDSNLSLVASYCTELTNLYLRRCSRLTDTGLQYVAKYCKQMREISLNECPRLTDQTLVELATHLGSQLRYLSMAKCCLVTDMGVAAVAGRCPRLRYVNLRGCSRVSDTSVEQLAAGCPRVRSLDLGGCDISDDSLEAFGQHCAQLRRLNLRSCDAVTDGGVTALARGCRALLLLNLHECSITGSAHEAVRRHCPACIIEHNNPAAFF